MELCRRFCVRLSGPIFGVKLNLHIYKTIKDFKISSLIDIAAANVCTMKKTGGLYHLSERRYFNVCPGRFSEIVAILTAPAVYASSEEAAYKVHSKQHYATRVLVRSDLCKK